MTASGDAAAPAGARTDDGRRAVQRLAERGVDFIEIPSCAPRDADFAIADECRRRGPGFTGHVPDAVRGAAAARAGPRSFEPRGGAAAARER